TQNDAFYKRFGIVNTTGFDAFEPLIQPRLALTYDVNDFAFFSRVQVHAGAGIFSGGDPLVWVANAFQNNGRLALATLQSPGICPTETNTFQYKVLDSSGKFTGFPACVVQAGAITA